MKGSRPADEVRLDQVGAAPTIAGHTSKPGITIALKAPQWQP